MQTLRLLAVRQRNSDEERMRDDEKHVELSREAALIFGLLGQLLQGSLCTAAIGSRAQGSKQNLAVEVTHV